MGFNACDALVEFGFHGGPFGVGGEWKLYSLERK